MSVDSSREAFLAALERLLSQPDAEEPGINAVARQAGLNKVLVYRYFGSWDGFLEAFARRVNPWRDLRIEAEAGLAEGRWATLRELAGWLFGEYWARLNRSVLLQNLLRLSLIQRNPLQKALEADRENEGLALIRAVAQRFPFPAGSDPGAVTALVIGGLTWLALSGPRVGQFNGLTFTGDQADAGARLTAALDLVVGSLTHSPSDATL